MDVAEINAKLATLSASVDALIAKPSTGIDPAALDPVGAEIDALTAKVNNAVSPPAP